MVRIKVVLSFYEVPEHVAREAAQQLLGYLGEEYANKRLPETSELMERFGGDVWGWHIDESEA